MKCEPNYGCKAKQIKGFSSLYKSCSERGNYYGEY